MFSRIVRSHVNQFRSTVSRKMGGGGGHHHAGPHVPEGYRVIGQGLLYVCYFWILYRLKVDGPTLFGFYKPWEHPHEHAHPLKFTQENVGVAPALAADDDHDDEEDDDHHH